MSTITPISIIKGDLKPFEEKIVNFYQLVGDATGLNSKTTKIFAYLQIYGALTQKQLKKLTNFSSSTISTTLNSFIQAGIVSREITVNARLGVYHLISEKLTFVYTEFSEIMKELEDFDEFIVDIQQVIHQLRNSFPDICEFCHRRLNSYRNYIEAQRRAINKTQKFSFLLENVLDLGFGDKIIEFPNDIEEIVQKFITTVVKNGVYDRDDPIANLIYNYLAIYNSMTQDFLEQKTGLSLSTISRKLNQFVKNNIIVALPKHYKQPRVYQLPSLSLSISQQILDADSLIFSWKPKFQNILETIEQSNYSTTSHLELIRSKISHLINQISEFQHGSKRLKTARDEILDLFEPKE